MTTGTSDAGGASATFEAVAGDMSVGLVIRSAADPCELMNIGEEDLVALVCEYLQLLETL